MTNNKLRITGVTLVFLSAITFPLINGALHLVPDIKNTENRAMAKEPALDIELLDPFPVKYEAYYNDHFSVRSRLISYYNDYNLNVMKKSPFPDHVAVGYNKWLFHMGREMESYTLKDTLSLQELETWRLILECQQKYLREQGCTFYFMVSPNKANIHSENVPYYYYRYASKCWGEQLLGYLEKNSTVNVISVYDRFRELKKDNQLYFKLDNHWNRLGAFYAGNAACERIGRDFPSVKPLPLSDYTVKQVQRKEAGDLGRMLGNPASFTDTDFEFIPKKVSAKTTVDNTSYVMYDKVISPQVVINDRNDTTKPKLMIVSDSFSNMLFPFLCESFGRTVKVFDMWYYSIYPALVESEKPDVYILMIFEPMLKPPHDTRAVLSGYCN